MKTNKITGKPKRVIIAAMAAICAISSAAAIGANAASETYTHTVSVATSAGSDDATFMDMKSNGEVTDTFSSYPTIYGNYSTSYNKSRVENTDDNTKTSYKYFTLQKNSPSYPSVFYGSVNKGYCRLYYVHVSNGGFKSSVDTVKRYN